MEALLEKIVLNTENLARNMEPKESFSILVSENSTQIRTKFNPLIQLDKNKKYEMALVNLETYNSFPNIDATNNHFAYSPDNGRNLFHMQLPEGSYEIVDINEYIQRIMKDNGHFDAAEDMYYIKLQANNTTLKSVLDIAPDYQVDLTSENTLGTVLGFKSQVYTSGYNESENIVNIMSVNSLRVTSDIIGSSYSNGTTDNIIYSFFPNVGPGYKILQNPTNLVYLPITLYTISSMETKLTDQNGKLINLRGEELSIRFQIREA